MQQKSIVHPLGKKDEKILNLCKEENINSE